LKGVFCSDLHGRGRLYERLGIEVARRKANFLVLGGDLAPHNSPREQGEFFTRFFLPFLEQLRASAPSLSRVFVMMGNDDWKSNLEILEVHEDDFLKPLHLRLHELGEGFYIAGYSAIPVSPLAKKDWERTERSPAGNERWIGTVSSKNGLAEVDISLDPERFSMAAELGPFMRGCPRGKTIFAFHSPPWGTRLDLIRSGFHVGSRTVRELIEELSPPLTLHGHVHESPEVSGRYWDFLGPSLCINPGQMLSAGLAGVAFEVPPSPGSVEHFLFPDRPVFPFSNILLAGLPGCGKTTLVKRVLEMGGWNWRGFLTEEETAAGSRTGFRIVTWDDRVARLAVKEPGEPRVGAYHVNVEAVESIAAKAIEESPPRRSILVIDEIGKMESLSPLFRSRVESALAKPHPVLATVPSKGNEWIQSLKKRADTWLVTVDRTNRDRLASETVRLIEAILSAQEDPAPPEGGNE